MEHIRLIGLSKSYNKKDESEVAVLNRIDLSIEVGDKVAIVGASGAGKSTLLNIIGALDRPSAGEVLYKNESIFKMDDKKLAAFRNKKVGFVFQSHHLLPEFSAVENVMLPALIGGSAGYADARSRAEGLLREVGLDARLDHRPGELSGGEQQRCAIVRALMQEPEVLLADEPTGNLDSNTGREVFKLLLKLNKEKNITLLIVTHNEELAARMNLRLTMQDGDINRTA
ncbi:Lipoprotein-releasing system ATP-binding protein LolD [hydrothermal vent metagenome]|uniref:Lipoprotein-releasing system ATP-binding protein LolD n=1 Tax=hydrothermal vent metagenome TaxID=652676 RepID=A0A3B0V1G2_9ZZZZ